MNDNKPVMIPEDDYRALVEQRDRSLVRLALVSRDRERLALALRSLAPLVQRLDATSRQQQEAIDALRLATRIVVAQHGNYQENYR